MSDNLFNADDCAAPQDSLALISELGNRLLEEMKTVEELEASLRQASERVNNLKFKLLPDAMASAGVAEIKLLDGSKIVVDDFVSGSLPKDSDKRSQAIRWLVENDGLSIIKTQVVAEFGFGERDKALELKRTIEKSGTPATIVDAVHPQTLCAFVREVLRSGKPIDPSVLGLYVGRVAKVKQARKDVS